MAEIGWMMGAEPHASVMLPDPSLMLVKVSQGPPGINFNMSQILTCSGAPESLA